MGAPPPHCIGDAAVTDTAICICDTLWKLVLLLLVCFVVWGARSGTPSAGKGCSGEVADDEVKLDAADAHWISTKDTVFYR